MRTRLATALLVAAAAGCESSAHRAERLRSGVARECGAANDMRGVHEGFSYTDSARAAQQTKCDLAQRDFNRFMSGR